MADEGECKGVLCLEPCQTRCGLEESSEFIALRKLTLFGGHTPGDLIDLLTPRQLVLYDHKQLLQLRWELHDRREDDDERPAGPTVLDLVGEGLYDLGRADEPMEVRENEYGRALVVAGRQGRNGLDRRDGITRGLDRLPANLKAAVDVPDSQGPFMLGAQTADLGQSVLVLVRLDPQAGECGSDVFVEGRGEFHRGVSFRS